MIIATGSVSAMLIVYMQYFNQMIHIHFLQRSYRDNIPYRS